MRACPFCMLVRLRIKLGLKRWLSPGVMLACALGLVLALLAASSHAHDNEVNRATLVLRDKGHLSATLYINYTDALHQAIAPQMSDKDFVMTYGAMDAPRFQAALAKAQAVFQAGTRLTRQDGNVLTLLRWQWPAPEQVQRLLRERSMALMVGGHVHERQQEITAELNSDRPIAAITARFPQAFGQVLLVSYRPEQTVFDGKSAALVHFPPSQ